MSITTLTTTGHLRLKDQLENILLPVKSVEIKTKPDLCAASWHGFYPINEITCEIDMNELTRCVLSKYPTFEKHLRAALAQVETEREAAKEQREQDLYKVRQAYREQKAEIDARAAELERLAAILTPAPAAPEHVNCKAAVDWGLEDWEMRHEY